MKTLKGLVLISAFVAGGVLSACSNAPGASPSLPAVSLPAIDPSAGAAAVVAILDKLQTEIAANESATGLTADERDALEGIVPAVQALGRRHDGYGVRDEHYATVGSALLWTLEQGLGAAFTPAVRNAWTEAYGTLASVMIEAANSESHGAEAAA